MSMEELKLIAETITQLGVVGKEAFIWWLLLDKVPPFLLWSAFISVLFYAGKKVSDAYSEKEYFKTLRDSLGIGCTGWLTDEEKDKTKAAIAKIVANQVKNTGEGK